MCRGDGADWEMVMIGRCGSRRGGGGGVVQQGRGNGVGGMGESTSAP